MKSIFLIVTICLTTLVTRAQNFHFVNHEFTLNKTTDQSPAHWYLEIYNDAGVDTNLRWKAHFDFIPTQWVIHFDDQSNHFTNVQNLDSADFVLQSGLPFPQKLIIGAETNNTIGFGSVLFEIYDPFTPTNRDTIIFNFNITQGVANLSELETNGNYKIENKQICLLNGEKSNFYLSDATGKIVKEKLDTDVFDLYTLNKSEIYFVQFTSGKKQHSLKIMND